ncbi:acyltransferase ChoActase/COT/CPT [Rhizopus microsporus var. microsporus]|uniref:Acyltransferase ChoActase/COT/CPT n=2 Tax=Rhizopus microsporus TaxID=58291 RepID=A0A2G4SMH7_RHIZD|nr:acyltransferase ChoActase/COT/CPT [Rhizopus microsporus ATCC 52813]ORE07198.1 acyltransferase ChoActase/COT/CPT [Rhizopus microsporus var. microsporus]PHZ09974.1 acyltransferase ChoActase/COT/CPT [Rhizopus microsporus ATCC 52813]
MTVAMPQKPFNEPSGGITFKYQDELPRLPIPDLESTLQKYLTVLKPLQTSSEHEQTKAAVKDFLENEGPELQKKLQTYATNKHSYIEEFWYDSYLHYTDSVVLNLNPFFLLEDDPTPLRNDQIVRASSLIYSTIIFIEALRNKTLEPDVFRGTPLCMSQFSRLFATARVPTENGCYIATEEDARHIVVMAQSQFYHFEVFDAEGKIILSEKQIAANLRAIVKDAAETPASSIAERAMGVLTTENRLNWARLRDELQSDETNAEALKVVDQALFIVCLDHVEPADTNELSTNMLCGTYKLVDGMQVGTCTNRWYDKLQIIVCKNGSAGINFEHTGVDGHTVLRFVSDIYTETILRFAKTINSQTKSIFHSYNTKKDGEQRRESSDSLVIDINPRRIEWKMTDTLRLGIKFAETRISDLILQNEVKVLEFNKYGKYFITDMKMSPDAFVQMAFQAAYYGLYGKCECTYEPAMTKTFYHGRTEAIRSVSDASVDFVTTYYSKTAPDQEKLNKLRQALKYHTKLTKECSMGLGQDRHLYALECVWDRLHKDEKKPKLFTDKGWKVLNHTVISTSNCGNPALRLFGFGPVVADGFGIGYIIKEDGIAFVASSKHRQTQRFLDTLKGYLLDIQKLLLNEKYPSGISSRQRVLELEETEELNGGYSYFDNGNHSSGSESSINRKKIGKRLILHETD